MRTSTVPPRQSAAGVPSSQTVTPSSILCACGHSKADHDRPGCAGACAAPERPGSEWLAPCIECTCAAFVAAPASNAIPTEKCRACGSVCHLALTKNNVPEWIDATGHPHRRMGCPDVHVWVTRDVRQARAHAAARSQLCIFLGDA